MKIVYTDKEAQPSDLVGQLEPKSTVLVLLKDELPLVERVLWGFIMQYNIENAERDAFYYKLVELHGVVNLERKRQALLPK